MSDPTPSAVPQLIGFDRNKDGSTSKKRFHNGNIPTLPQDKLCPHCPARFTRNGHLNRHMRTHLDHKSHECDRCHAQFTRRDMLTRHWKGRCHSSGNKSRKKSCIPCAESKQKCDAGRPCARCDLRDRDCRYVTDGKRSLQDDGQPVPLKNEPESSSVDSKPIMPVEQKPTVTPLATERQLSNEVFETFLSNIFSVANTTEDLGKLLLSTEPVDGTVYRSNKIIDFEDSSSYSVKNIGRPPNFARQQNVSNITEPLPPLPLYPNVVAPPPARISDFSMSPEEKLRTAWPTETELSHYLYLFFTYFLIQMPLIHVPTWTMERKPRILITAMQTCGALYVQSEAARCFVESTLKSTRDALIAELTLNSTDHNDQIYLILAVAMIQSIGLFHKRRDHRASSNIYHGMIVMLIRKSGLIAKVSEWKPPYLNGLSPHGLDLAWKEWATFETAKRAISMAFLHDTACCIYFSFLPIFKPGEFNVPLPCETALWQCGNSHEWLMEANNQDPALWPSPWNRLVGPPVYDILTQLKMQGIIPKARVLSGFAHFIIVRIITMQINDLSLRKPQGLAVPQIEGESIQEIKKAVLQLQYSLHNWLQDWLVCPDAKNQRSENIPILANALPYFWVAQVSLIAYQKGLSPFCFTMSSRRDERILLMKEWLRMIRVFLRNGQQSASLFFDELTRIRQRDWDSEGDEDYGGVLTYFV